MKKYLLTLFLFIPLIALCQDNQLNIPLKDGRVVYSGVIQRDSISKNELYTAAKVWFANTFRNVNNVIKFDDKDAGKIIGNGSFPIRYTYFFETIHIGIDFSIMISVKDSKYKYEIYDIIMTGPTGYTTSAESHYSDVLNKKSGRIPSAKQLEAMDKEMLSIEKSLLEAMRKANTSDDDF